MKTLIALALSGLIVSSGPFLSSHALEEGVEQIRSASGVEACQPGNGHGLVPDHTLLVEPLHVCVICKTFNGTLLANIGITVPLFGPSAGTFCSPGVKHHFAGFFRVSRSPPSRS